MKINHQGSTIRVELEDQVLSYNKNDWSTEETFLTENGVEKLPEWKIDLIQNHGVDKNELRS